MSDAEKIKILADALNEANKLIFDNGASHGSPEYHKLRQILVNGLKHAGQKAT